MASRSKRVEGTVVGELLSLRLVLLVAVLAFTLVILKD